MGVSLKELFILRSLIERIRSSDDAGNLRGEAAERRVWIAVQTGGLNRSQLFEVAVDGN